MWRVVSFFLITTVLIAGGWYLVSGEAFQLKQTDTTPSITATKTDSYSHSEAGFAKSDSMPIPLGYNEQYTDIELQNWQRPAGPPRVGLQVGHLRNDEVPTELSGLTRNGAGATWGPYTERATMQNIVERAAAQLEAAGIEVDILPATVPPRYVADAFVSVHADGNPNEQVRGFKVADFSHDYSGLSQYLESSLYDAYASSTGLPQDDTITYYMSGYYAFNWWRYEHAVHPMTPAVILETGFLTNAADRNLLLNEPDMIAEGIVNGIQDFLDTYSLQDAERKDITLRTTPLRGFYQCFPVELDADDREIPPESCRAGIVLENGDRIGLATSTAVSQSKLTSLGASSTIEVDGQYTPMIGVRDLFWYDFGVSGVVQVERVSTSSVSVGR